MAKVVKVEGFSSKEQKILNALSNGEQHNIRELKKLFWEAAKAHCAEIYEKGWGEHEVNGQAQSYVRNSVRRLIRDGWVEGPHMNENLPRGTYKLTRSGRDRVAKGVSITPSLKERDARREERMANTAAKKAKKAPKAKKASKTAAPKKAKAKVKAKPANGAQAKAQAAKAKVSKEAAREKAQDAARRAAEEPKSETSTPTAN